MELAAKHSVPIRCVLFTAPAEVCEHNDVVRSLNKEVCHPPHLVLLKQCSAPSHILGRDVNIELKLNYCLR